MTHTDAQTLIHAENVLTREKASDKTGWAGESRGAEPCALWGSSWLEGFGLCSQATCRKWGSPLWSWQVRYSKCRSKVNSQNHAFDNTLWSSVGNIQVASWPGNKEKHIQEAQLPLSCSKGTAPFDFRLAGRKMRGADNDCLWSKDCEEENKTEEVTQCVVFLLEPHQYAVDVRDRIRDQRTWEQETGVYPHRQKDGMRGSVCLSFILSKHCLPHSRLILISNFHLVFFKPDGSVNYLNTWSSISCWA